MAPGRQKFVCIGDDRVGKTAFLHTFVGQPFPEVYQTTVSETYLAQPIKGGPTVELVDLPGAEEFDRSVSSIIHWIRALNLALC
jgi:GTPase SAR1 family protein